MRCLKFCQSIDQIDRSWRVDLEYPIELQELQNHYPLAQDKIEMKREMLSEYQLNISDLYKISIGNIKS